MALRGYSQIFHQRALSGITLRHFFREHCRGLRSDIASEMNLGNPRRELPSETNLRYNPQILRSDITFADQVLGDNNLLNLRGSFIEAEQTHITVETFD